MDKRVLTLKMDADDEFFKMSTFGDLSKDEARH